MISINKLKSYIELARIDKPIGIYLLLWPSMLGLLLAGTINEIKIIDLFIVIIGSILVRSCGCVINDISDYKIDKLVSRTVGRPLATGALSIFNLPGDATAADAAAETGPPTRRTGATAGGAATAGVDYQRAQQEKLKAVYDTLSNAGALRGYGSISAVALLPAGIEAARAEARADAREAAAGSAPVRLVVREAGEALLVRARPAARRVVDAIEPARERRVRGRGRAGGVRGAGDAVGVRDEPARGAAVPAHKQLARRRRRRRAQRRARAGGERLLKEELVRLMVLPPTERQLAHHPRQRGRVAREHVEGVEDELEERRRVPQHARAVGPEVDQRRVERRPPCRPLGVVGGVQGGDLGADIGLGQWFAHGSQHGPAAQPAPPSRPAE